MAGNFTWYNLIKQIAVVDPGAKKDSVFTIAFAKYTLDNELARAISPVFHSINGRSFVHIKVYDNLQTEYILELKGSKIINTIKLSTVDNSPMIGVICDKSGTINGYWSGRYKSDLKYITVDGIVKHSVKQPIKSRSYVSSQLLYQRIADGETSNITVTTTGIDGVSAQHEVEMPILVKEQLIDPYTHSVYTFGGNTLAVLVRNGDTTVIMELLPTIYNNNDNLSYKFYMVHGNVYLFVVRNTYELWGDDIGRYSSFLLILCNGRLINRLDNNTHDRATAMSEFPATLQIALTISDEVLIPELQKYLPIMALIDIILSYIV